MTASNDNRQQGAVYRRIVLKLGGEALAGPDGRGIDPEQAELIADRVKSVHDLGVQIAVVVGGGNLWRGSTGVERGMEQTTADHMGMIATVMNGLALADALQRRGVETRVQTAIEMKAIAEPYIRLRAIRHLEKGRIVIIEAGIGNPYFTTDTAAALRAMEINAEIVIKATKVDGVYSADPTTNPNATRFSCLTYQQVLDSKFRVMDMTAFTLCQENNMPILVLNFWEDEHLLQAVTGSTEVGTLISQEGTLL